MKYYTFYHNDMDGKSAAYCVRNYLAKIGAADSPVNYQRHGYVDKWKLSKLDKDTTAFIVDLSFTEMTYKELLSICVAAGHVIWIDHHESSVKLLQSHPEIAKMSNLSVFVCNDGCGALLTYFYCLLLEKGGIKIEDVEGKGNILLQSFTIDYAKKLACVKINKTQYRAFIPRWIIMVDDYDRWQKRSEDSELFIFGCDSMNTGLSVKQPDGSVIFNDEFWSLMSDPNKVLGLIEDGRTIKRHIDSSYRRELLSAFEYTLEDGTILLCKNGRGNARNFQDEINNYAAVVLFSYDGKNNVWRHSVYSAESSTFDCAKFCEPFWGGGHVHAAGFSSPKPIFVPEGRQP